MYVAQLHLRQNIITFKNDNVNEKDKHNSVTETASLNHSSVSSLQIKKGATLIHTYSRRK
jgi:hypothetical protein